MLCSVIIPLYNKESVIEVALQSILNQQYQNFEVIVIDDGSTDAGPALVSAVQDQRIQLIQQANSGVSCARNRGIELAKGELVCFLDADDWYHPMFLETIISMAKRYPEIPFMATKSLVFRKSDVPKMTWDIENINFLLIDDLFDYWRHFGVCFFTGSVAIRREFLNSFQPCFPPGESMGEDLDLWFRLAEASSIAYCPIPLVAYRHMDGSLCDTNKDLMTLLPVYSRLEQRIRHGQIPDKLRSSALRMVLDAKVSIARKLLMTGRRYDAYMELLGNYWGVRSKRWWVTLIMCAFFSPFLVRRWERWRDPKARV